jgi:hypothetical protein
MAGGDLCSPHDAWRKNATRWDGANRETAQLSRTLLASPITPRGQRVAVWPQASGALRGGAPVTLGGEDRVSAGRAGGASRSRALRSDHLWGRAGAVR